MFLPQEPGGWRVGHAIPGQVEYAVSGEQPQDAPERARMGAGRASMPHERCPAESAVVEVAFARSVVVPSRGSRCRPLSDRGSLATAVSIRVGLCP